MLKKTRCNYGAKSSNKTIKSGAPVQLFELGFHFGTLVITEKNAGVVRRLNVGGESRIAHSCCDSCLLYCTVREQIRFYYLLFGNER